MPRALEPPVPARLSRLLLLLRCGRSTPHCCLLMKRLQCAHIKLPLTLSLRQRLRGRGREWTMAVRLLLLECKAEREGSGWLRLRMV
jgi:hypothetical protein